MKESATILTVQELCARANLPPGTVVILPDFQESEAPAFWWGALAGVGASAAIAVVVMLVGAG